MRKHIFTVFLTVLVVSAQAQRPLVGRDTSVSGPQTFAIIVGISNYKYVKPLQFADKDAELFRDYLKSPAGGNVKDDNIFCLLNEKASNANFWGKGFQWLRAKRLQKGDRLFIYLAGHGDAIDEDQFFFLGYDCNPAGDKNNYLVSGAIQLFNLKKKIAAETARGVEVVFIMDACRSNELPGGTEGLSFLNTAITQKKAGEIMMLATGAGQEALEDSRIGNGHGLFSYYLVDGLSGLADSKTSPDRRVSLEEIENYVEQNVPRIAQQLFKRKQDPYFCCSEKNQQVISRVDSSYLLQWMKRRSSLQSAPEARFIPAPAADTALLSLFRRFNTAVQNKTTAGRNEAERYYNELESKYASSPYTADARSSLAVAYLDFAQQEIDDYLACSQTDQGAMQESAARLERAIQLFQADDEDFAASLMHRLCLLKAATGDALAIHNAHRALNIHPQGSYILNQLARLHLQFGNRDSAYHYARRAKQVAPKWACAATTFDLIQRAVDSSRKKKEVPARRVTIGFSVGAGAAFSTVRFSKSNWRQGNINYNDSLNNITTSGGGRAELGAFLQWQAGTMVAFRPDIRLVFDRSSVDYERKPAAGVPVIEKKVLNRTLLNLSLPVQFRFGRRNTVPYLLAGPAFALQLNRADTVLAPKKLDMQGQVALGLEIRGPRLIVSPELKYGHGFSNLKGSRSNLYLNTISELQNRSLVFTVYLRKR
ncbi:MAG TPA: caspase family protein [Chitinophagaceae bacterium]|nr:caspase family protein [Chitinophagaceae bacterium]